MSAPLALRCTAYAALQDPELWAEFEAAVAALRAIPPLKAEIVDVLGLHYSFDVPAVR